MTNKIKENIIIFWGGLAICLYIANSFEWIDINQWLQQTINYKCTFEEVTRKFIPILLTILALIGIAKIIIVSFQLGQLSIPSARHCGKQEVKLLPSLSLDEQPYTGSHTEHIRDRHLQEQIALRQQILNSIHDYLFHILPPYMKDEDIESLFHNVNLWQYSQETPLSPTMTNGKLSTLDLRHLAWNVGERLKWAGEKRALFIKQSFPNEFRDSDISSIRRNLRQQGDCIIKIDVPDKHDYQFHQFEV
ncbi:MAG: hypothetical protein ACI3YX_00095 [Prevotella sp.]|nr:hypothetical protein [Prevotellaceae bacterium]MDY5843637.1 hypothetical protein [Prevotella sp.]